MHVAADRKRYLFLEELIPQHYQLSSIHTSATEGDFQPRDRS